MAGMPAMQEQLPANAMDCGYAGNAGAISGWRRGRPDTLKRRASFRRPADDLRSKARTR
jgi:hypothetical protein